MLLVANKRELEPPKRNARKTLNLRYVYRSAPYQPRATTYVPRPPACHSVKSRPHLRYW